ncbi:ATP-binding cassette domain-containing protein [Enemella sp. A6]|uniref:ATP-binding cassette domain-containing protein n=1 Tax=Enemella sp. A6 TaxID=3440152 RepID=UPI003EBDCAEC
MTTNAHPILGCRGLVKSFGGHRVLNGLDLTVTPGRVYALLGRNGAGKSTSLKIMLGLLPADAGTGYLLGKPWQRDSLSKVGASIDGPALYSHLSARNNLRVHARLTGVDDNRVTAVLQQVGLADTGKKKAKTFSTGMKARLALAIALLTDPEVLVLDEPQNGLDPEGIIELRSLIRSLAAAGRTVLISSHQLGEVVRLADDIGVLASGRLVYEGPLADFAHDDLEGAYLAATGQVPAPTGQVRS